MKPLNNANDSHQISSSFQNTRARIDSLKTPGKDYVFDTQYAIKKLKLNTVLTISADLPLVTSEVIEKVRTFAQTYS